MDNEAGVGRFMDAIRPAFRELRERASAHADAMDGRGPRDAQPKQAVYRFFDDAREAFAAAVEANWPFATDTEADLRATKAYQDAMEIKEAYHEGRATRAAAVAKFVQTAEDNPGTVLHDQALLMAAMLYLQGLSGGAKRDLPAAQALLRRLANRPGPPSGFVLMAQEELAGQNPDPAVRMRERSAFYGNARQRADVRWLEENALTPTADETPRMYLNRTSGLLVHVRGVQYTSCKNMVADATMTADPIASLNWLKDRHPGDEFVQKEVQTALG